MDLNQKILEFAGFKALDKKGTCWQLWQWPDGRKAFTGDLPDFTDPVWGIAHLFKWVVPKVYDMELYKVNRFEGEWQAAYRARVRLARKHWLDYCTDKEPALALCYAVEKLIDAQVPIEVI